VAAPRDFGDREIAPIHGGELNSSELVNRSGVDGEQ
jgi:hypothetical protein